LFHYQWIEFGLILKVSAMTLKELNRRISFDSRVLINHPIPTNLSAIGYNFLTEENFVSSFWKQSKEEGISSDDFITKYRNIDILLESQDIQVEKSMPIHDESFAKNWTETLGKINQRDDHEKSNAAADHDAYLITLIDDFRKGQPINRFLDNPAWVLTTDQFLMRFQKTQYPYKEKAPFALLPTQLIQILRFVRPTDNKFNEMFLDVFSKFFIPISDGLSNENILVILARISQYKGYTPLLADKVLSDQYFTNSFKNSQTEGEKEELIHDAIVEKAGEMELLVKEKGDKLVELETQVHILKTNQEHYLEESEVKKQVIEKTFGDLEDAKKETASATELIQKLQKKLEESDLRDANRQRQYKFYRNILLELIYGGVAAYLIFNIGNNFAYLNIIVKSIIMAVLTLGNIALTFILFENKKISTLVSTVIGLVFTISALYYSILFNLG
jgi:hypothetical protein